MGTNNVVDETTKSIEELAKKISKVFEEMVNAARQYHEKENKDNPYAIMIER